MIIFVLCYDGGELCEQSSVPQEMNKRVFCSPSHLPVITEHFGYNSSATVWKLQVKRSFTWRPESQNSSFLFLSGWLGNPIFSTSNMPSFLYTHTQRLAHSPCTHTHTHTHLYGRLCCVLYCYFCSHIGPKHNKHNIYAYILTYKYIVYIIDNI